MRGPGRRDTMPPMPKTAARCLLALALLAAAPSAAHAALSEPLQVTPAGTAGYASELNTNASGTTAYVFQADGGATPVVGIRAPGGDFVTEPIPGAGPAIELDSGIDDSGRVTAVWSEKSGANYSVKAATRSAAGVWSSIQTVVGPATNVNTQVHVAVNGSGFAVLLYEMDGATDAITHVYSSVRDTATGTFAAGEKRSTAEENNSYAEVRVNDTGDAVIAYTRNTSGSAGLYGTVRPAGGAWKAEANIVSGSGQYFYANELAINDAGRIAVSFGNQSNFYMSLRTVSDTLWTAATELLPTCEGNQGRPGALGIDSAGTATLAFVCGSSGSYELRTTTWGSGLADVPVTANTPLSTTVSDSYVDMDVLPSGEALITYTDGGKLGLARRPAGGTFAKIPLPAGLPEGGGYEAQLNPGGGLLATYFDMPAGDTKGFVDDAVLPTIAVGGPATGTTGTLLSFTATAADAWAGLDGPVTWSISDGSAPTGASISKTFTAPGTYQLTASVKDRAGNTGTAQKTVVISAPVTPPPGGGGGGGGGGGTVVTPPATVKRCVVPKLRNTSLDTAKKRIKKANCKVGTIKKPKKKRPKGYKTVVRSTSVDAGKRLKAGSKVSLRLGYVKVKKK